MTRHLDHHCDTKHHAQYAPYAPCTTHHTHHELHLQTPTNTYKYLHTPTNAYKRLQTPTNAYTQGAMLEIRVDDYDTLGANDFMGKIREPQLQLHASNPRFHHHYLNLAIIK